MNGPLLSDLAPDNSVRNTFAHKKKLNYCKKLQGKSYKVFERVIKTVDMGPRFQSEKCHGQFSDSKSIFLTLIKARND